MKKKAELFRIGLFAIVLSTGIVITYTMTKASQRLKIYNPADINPDLVDSTMQGKTRKHRVADFKLTSQEGKTVTAEDFRGKIYVTDFFFTTCQSICPKMSAQMERVYETYKGNDNVMLLSHTVDPERDSVPVLAEYSGKFDADPEKWLFVTGDKQQIYELARKSYFAVTTEGDGGKHDFIHTENFILVDKEKRIRGFYDGTSEKEVDKLIEDILILLNEYES